MELGEGAPEGPAGFFPLGVGHILGGWDHLLFLAAALPLLLWMQRARWEPRAVRAASLGVAAVGAFWLVQRLFLA